MSPPPTIDLEGLGFEEGAHLLLKRALAAMPVGARLEVRGRDPSLAVHLRAWCRAHGHRVEWPDTGLDGDVVAVVVRGDADDLRWAGAERAGAPGGVVDHPSPPWGLAARGALVEAGGPAMDFSLDDGRVVWADVAPKLYAQAAAGQWDPATAVDWAAPRTHPADVEAAVVQVMTYLVENEQAALVVPARFLGRIHPHFREVVQLLAVQVADEARHVEVFTRRALLGGDGRLGVSGAGGRASLATLVAETDFSEASFLLSVLGEGSFLNLLSFLERHAPDAVTRQGLPPGPAGRGPPRRLRPGPPRAPGGRRSVPARPPAGGGGAPPRRPGRHRRPQRRGLRRPGRAGRRLLGRRPPWPRATAGCNCCRRRWTRAASAASSVSASRPPRPPPCPPSTPATSCSADEC